MIKSGAKTPSGGWPSEIVLVLVPRSRPRKNERIEDRGGGGDKRGTEMGEHEGRAVSTSSRPRACRRGRHRERDLLRPQTAMHSAAAHDEPSRNAPCGSAHLKPRSANGIAAGAATRSLNVFEPAPHLITPARALVRIISLPCGNESGNLPLAWKPPLKNAWSRFCESRRERKDPRSGRSRGVPAGQYFRNRFCMLHRHCRCGACANFPSKTTATHVST